MSPAEARPMPVEAELKALHQALDAENRRAIRAEERVLELADLAEGLRRRLTLRQRHDGENLRAIRAEAKVRELEAVIAQLRRGPAKSRVGGAS